jgi:hypothetical protein
MKNWRLTSLLLLLAITTFNFDLSSQCVPRSNFFWGEMFPNNGCGTFATYGPYSPGEYFRMPILQGGSYTISTCGAGIDTQITGFQGTNTTTPIFYNDDNGPICSPSTQASITYVSAFTDYTRVEVSEFNCQPGGSQCITVNVRQNNNLTFTSSSADMCVGEVRNLTATPAPVPTGSSSVGAGNEGTFSGTGVSGTTFTAPNPAGASQTFTVQYDFGYCSTIQNITVFATPSTANAGTNQTVPALSTNLAATPPNIGTGTWTIISGAGGSITSPNSPTSMFSGLDGVTYTLRWTVTNGPCTQSIDDVDITFNAGPMVSFTAPTDLCVDAGVQTDLDGGTPPQGTVAGDMGVYSGPGVTDDGNGMTYSFDPAAAGVGIHTLSYMYTDENGLSNTATDNVEVFALPVVMFTALTDLCVDAGVQAGLGGGSPTGGVYSGSGVIDNGNGMTYSFNPAIAGVGPHTLTYNYTDINGCTNSASDDVQVFAIPNVTFTALADLCLDAGVQTGLGGGSPSGGIYSGPGVTDDGNGMTYSFDPAAAGVGDHTITYNYTDSNGCGGSASDMVEVFDLPAVGLSTALYYCLDAPIQSVPITGGSPMGGVYSGIGVTDLGNGTSYNFDPTVNGPGMVTITYTYTDANGCTDIAMSDLEVLDCGAVNNFEPDDPCSCLDNATVIDLDAGTGGDDGQFSEVVSISNATGAPLPSGQTWTVVGATGAFDEFNIPPVGVQSAGVPTASDGSVTLSYSGINGIYEIPFVHVDDIGYTLMIEGPFMMGSPANTILTISNRCQYPDPVFDPVIPATINSMDPIIILGGMDTNGGTADGITFTIDGSPATMIDPSVLAMGPHTVVMTYDGADDGNGGVSPDGGATAASPGCIQEVQQTFDISVCILEVTCPQVTDLGTFTCNNPAPPLPANQTEAEAAPYNIVFGMSPCGIIQVDASDDMMINSCGTASQTITRTVFIWDDLPGGTPGVFDAGLEESSTCIFTYNYNPDGTPPTITCPTNISGLNCNDPVPVGAMTGDEFIAQGGTILDNCTSDLMDFTVTFMDSDIGTNCPGDPRTITRTYTVTDACGNPSMCTQIITYAPPGLPTLNCPSSETILLNPGECDFEYVYDVTGTADCNPNPVIMQLQGPPSGSLLPRGSTTVFEYSIDDGCTVVTCMWEVTVEEAGDASGALACNDRINTSLGEDCTLILQAEMFLEGPYGCSNDYTFMINGVESNIITECGTYDIMVMDPDGNNACNSVIVVEDKLGPDFPMACMRDAPCEKTCDTPIDAIIADTDAIVNAGITDCSGYTITGPSVEIIPALDCVNPDTLVLTYAATDGKGNVSSKSYYYTLRPLDFGTLEFPGPHTGTCDGPRSPDDTGRPTVEGKPVSFGSSTTAQICDILIAYTDLVLPTCEEDCDGSVKIIRSWTATQLVY